MEIANSSAYANGSGNAVDADSASGTKFHDRVAVLDLALPFPAVIDNSTFGSQEIAGLTPGLRFNGFANGVTGSRR